jgi:hypothetical protein
MRFAATLSSHTVSGDVWHMNLAFAQDGQATFAATPTFDSPKFCAGCSIFGNRSPGFNDPVHWTHDFSVPQTFASPPAPPDPLAAQHQSEQENDALMVAQGVRNANIPTPITCPATFAPGSLPPAEAAACNFKGPICLAQTDGKITDDLLVCDGTPIVQTFGAFFNPTLFTKYGWPTGQDWPFWNAVLFQKVTLQTSGSC